jgi:restriction system protein
MHNYSTSEINTVAVLIVFLLYFIVKIWSFFHAFKNRSLLSRTRTLKKLKKLSWADFEKLCMELFEKKGWQVRGNEKKGADGGVDIWMSKGGFVRKTSAIVQCKRYDDALVTIKVIREMYGLVYAYEVDKAYVVTSSRFTKECYKFIEEKPIVLIDGEALLKMIGHSSS